MKLWLVRYDACLAIKLCEFNIFMVSTLCTCTKPFVALSLVFVVDMQGVGLRIETQNNYFALLLQCDV